LRGEGSVKRRVNGEGRRALHARVIRVMQREEERRLGIVWVDKKGGKPPSVQLEKGKSDAIIFGRDTRHTHLGFGGSQI